jgi:hypothetical protein
MIVWWRLRRLTEIWILLRSEGAISLAGGLPHVANVRIRRLEQWKRLVAKHRLDDDIASRREVERVLCD